MLNAKVTQYKLGDDGQISFQSDASNPMPGELVARVLKGRTILEPLVEILPSAPTPDKEAGRDAVQTWLKSYIVTVLEPLVMLLDGEELQDPVRGIVAQLFSAMGILPREQVEGLIANLDQDTRRILRSKKVRLGPILVFQPDLNKPAAVRLRAMLWSLFNDKPLPAPVPKDGVVSFAVDPKEADKDFYMAVGYPIYGGRAIRIDMLDRVISAVYDGAEGGKFKAEHKMAEWLGCSIEGLYAVLEAMGHKKIFDPAEVAAKEDEAEKPAIEAEEKLQEKKPQEQVKPELATFRLKKGKAFEKQVERKILVQKQKQKPEKKKGKRNKSTNHTPKVMSAVVERKAEDSPFAILGQLKIDGGKDAG